MIMNNLIRNLSHNHAAESQTFVYCYHGSGCSDSQVFSGVTTKEDCCTSPSDLRTYRGINHETCGECLCTYYNEFSYSYSHILQITMMIIVD